MSSTTLAAFAATRAERGMTTRLLSLAVVVLALCVVIEAICWRNSDIRARDKHPQIVMITPYGHAQMVDFNDVSESALSSVARNELREFVHSYYGRNAATITRDLAKSWSMLDDAQRAQRRQEFAQTTADCAANPSQQIQISVSAVTILSTESLKTQAPHEALVDFEKVYMAEGHELRRELWTASVKFEVHGHPDQGSDVAADNPLGLAIGQFRAEKAL